MAAVTTETTIGLPFGLWVDQNAGVAGIWLLDPDPDDPELTVLEQDGGRYAPVAEVRGAESWTAERPFPVTIVPHDLLADLRP